MISIFHKEETGVECHSFSHKAPFCFIVNTLIKLQENITIANRDFPKVVLKKKTVILHSYIKQDRNRLVTRSTCKTCLVTHSTRLATRSTLSTRLSTRSTPLSTLSTRLSTRSTCFSTRSTRLSIRLLIRSTCFSTRSTPLSTGSICLSTRSARNTICQSFYNRSVFILQN